MVTRFTSAITDLILIFKAIHLQIVLLCIIYPTTTTKCQLWLHLKLRKIVRHGSLTLGPLIIWLKILRLSLMFKHTKEISKLLLEMVRNFQSSTLVQNSFYPTFRNFHLKKVYHVFHLTTNLISVSKFCTNDNVFFEFHPKLFLVKDQVLRQVLLQGQLKKWFI